MATDDIESLASNFSEVSFRDDLVSAEQAVDLSIKDIQDGLNNTQVALREMLQLDERGESYDLMKAKFDEIEELLKDGISLFKELRGLAKQLVPPKPRANTAKKAATNVLEDCKGGI